MSDGGEGWWIGDLVDIGYVKLVGVKEDLAELGRVDHSGFKSSRGRVAARLLIWKISRNANDDNSILLRFLFKETRL